MKYCSNTAVEENLKHKLIREGETRWLSKLYLLQSVAKNIEDLTQQRRKEEFSRFFNHDVRAAINFLHDNSIELEEVIKYFKMYEEPIICFQSSKPLLHAVWPFVLQMKVSLFLNLVSLKFWKCDLKL